MRSCVNYMTSKQNAMGESNGGDIIKEEEIKVTGQNKYESGNTVVNRLEQI